MRKETVDIIRDVVNTVTATVVITSAVDNLDGTFTIYSNNTYWLSKGDTITIGSDDYFVNSFTQNVSFIITPVGSGILPVATSFALRNPTYIHGTVKMAQNEVDANINKMDLVPFIYLYEVLRDKENTDESSAIDREAVLRIFFLNSSSFKDMLTEDIRENVTKPLRSMVQEFIRLVKNSKYFTDVMDYETMNLDNFSEEGNQKKSIFDCNLSGIELKLSAEIRKDLSCGDYTPIPNICEPAFYEIKYKNGTPIASGTIQSGGSETIEVPNCPSSDPVTYEILDSASNVLYSGSVAAGGNLSQAINDSVATLKDSAGNVLSTTNLLAEGTADIIAPDSTITVNGNAFGNALSGGSLDVPVEYENGTPVGTIVGGIVEIPNPVTCADATVENSDQSYSDTVASGGTLVLPDTSYDVYLNGNLKSSFSLITLKNDNINITIN